MLTTGTPARAKVASELVPYALWVRHSCDAALRSFQSERMAAAAAILGADRRVRLTGSGIGHDAARFGAHALSESGFETSAVHAHDLAAFPSRFEPGETVIGIDSDAPEVGTALRRARAAGLRTIALTDRELTLVRADVLLPHPGRLPNGPLPASPLAACYVLALMSARLEPGASIAREVAHVPAILERLDAAPSTAASFARDLRSPGRRLILASAGPARWAADSVARRINGMPGPEPRPTVLSVHLADLCSPDWPLRPDDAVVFLDPGEPAARSASQAIRPPRSHATSTWRIGGAPSGAAWHTGLSLESPALTSLCALYFLEQLIVELASA